MALPAFTMRQLLEAGVHFGHSTRRWNPKMAPYLFGVRNGIHIIDLRQTVPMLHRAMVAVRDVVAGGGRVLFVGTKRQASDKVAEAAKRCGQYYLNHRWLGGTMTNWQTISKSIKHLRDLDEQLASEESQGLTKKELLRLTRKRDKLERALGGIKEMGGLPDILIVIDTNKEAIAIAEANKIGIPVVGITDSNSDPKGIDYIIPGNDDAIRAINVYCDLMAATVIDGIQAEMTATGVDLGEAQEAPAEALPAKSEAAKPAAEAAVADKAPAKAVPVKSEAAKPDAAAAPVAPVTQTDKTADAVETPAEAAVADKAPAKSEVAKSEAAKPDAAAAPVASVDKTEAATGEAKKDSPAEESPPPQDAPRASAGE